MKKIILIVLCVLALVITAIFAPKTNNESNIEETITAEIEEPIVEEEIKEDPIIEEIEKENEKPIYNDVNVEEYENNLISIAEENNVYGMQVVVFKGEDILESFNYGYADIYSKSEVNDDTVFRIASISKMISNILIMKLVDEGKINLDSKLKEVTGLNFDENVELYHILTHTSGINDSAEFNENMDKVLDINHLLDISSVNKPGKVYNYTNFGAGTMSAIVESITNEYFMDYAQKELFDYLDLNAGYVCECLDEGTEIAKMYSDGEIIDPATWIYNYDFYRSFELGKQYRLSYGNLYISASDLAKLGMVLAGNGMLNNKSVLSYNALNQIRTIYNEALGQPYLMGLNTDFFDNYVKGRRIYGHTGSAYGAISALMYDPSDSTGVVILTNHATNRKNEKNITSLFYDIVNLTYKEYFD